MYLTPARDFAPGIGQAVADRTITRKKTDGTIETWADVAYRVAAGSVSLHPATAEFEMGPMHHHLRQASVLMSGRHLQHGDETQASRNIEVFSNCSTSASTFILFYLLLNGSGVGRSYDDDMMIVDWAGKMPKVVLSLRADHPDVLSGEISQEYVNVDSSKFGKTKTYLVPDSREGWAKAVEQVEFMTWQGIHADTTLLIDFSDVRARNLPIAGMQNRPASGPGPMMEAIKQIAAIRGNGMAPWKATMHADHYAAECVLVGGARRAARMATKSWRDTTVFEFVSVKKGGVLWSSNNSVIVDEEFWKLVKADAADLAYESAETVALANHAKGVFEAICDASYHDGTGEPGIINGERLTQKNEGVEVLFDGDYAESDRFKLDQETKQMTAVLAKVFAGKKFQMITNPCVTADTWVETSKGPRQVSELLDEPYLAVVNGKTHQSTAFWKTGDKPVFKVKTVRGYEVRATADHKILVETSRKRRLNGTHNVEHEWIEVQNLEPGDKIVLNDLSGRSLAIDKHERDKGWMVGEMVGDGGYNPEKYRGYVRFWGQAEGLGLAQKATDLAASLMEVFSPIAADSVPNYNRHNDTYTVSSRRLCHLADGLIGEGGKQILPALEKASESFVSGFLRGFFDADGSVQGTVNKGYSIRLAQSDLERLKAVQRMLLRLGIASTVYEGRREAQTRMMPSSVRNMLASYECKAQHELVISKSSIAIFAAVVGFYEPLKAERLDEAIAGYGSRGAYTERFVAEVEAITADGIEAVYDCTVEDVHRFDANGIIVHNCGEISLSAIGGYCLIADVVPYHAAPNWSVSEKLASPVEFARLADADAEDAFRVATRALLRTNTMNALYQKEVDRTNRIGVGITGLHEYAWGRFGYGWKDLVDEAKSIDFWRALSRFSNACVDEADTYSEVLGQSMPHTVTTMKPAGTTSKLFGLTEGAHLPSMREYLRWVQFRNGDPLIEDYAAKGYPVRRDLKTYSGTTIVGFPTAPMITTFGMGDKLVTAAEATPEEQYEYLRLLEKWWIDGYVEDAELDARHSYGNQNSYTLKYDPKVVNYEAFRQTLMNGQSTVKCCSVMPQIDDSAYEYQPEEPTTPERYAAIMAAISGAAKEDIGQEHLGCAGGACPISFNENSASS